MKRSRLLLSGLLLAVLCLAGSSVLYLATFRKPSSEALRAELLTLAPRGTTVDDVEALIREHHWDQGKCWSIDDNQVMRQISIQYDGYSELRRFPWMRTTIEAHFHFDPAGRLCDIALHRFPEPFPGQEP
jgi:hypothetical protein